MKKTILLALVSLFGLFCAAQRIDLDRFYFNASYRELPRKALDTSYRTYSVQVEAGPLTKLALKEEAIVQEVFIDGWKKLQDHGHLLINATLEDVIVEKSEVQERVEIIKDKNGKQIGTKNHYFMKLTYTYSGRVSVNDYRGNRILSTTLATRENKLTYNSPEYDSKLEAQVYFSYNVIPVTSELSRQVVTNALRGFSNRLTTDYGFSQRSVRDFMWILDSKKHAEYDEHRRAWLVIKQAFFRMNADEPLDEIREMLQPAIAYLNKVKKRYPGSSKHDRKLRYASYYNLAKIYYYLDDPESAMREATELVLNKFDARDGRQMESWANDLKWIFEQNKLYTRHFAINTDQYAGPEVSAATRTAGDKK